MSEAEIFKQSIITFVDLYFPNDNILKRDMPNLSKIDEPDVYLLSAFIHANEANEELQKWLMQYSKFYRVLSELYFNNLFSIDYNMCLKELELILNKDNSSDYLYFWWSHYLMHGFGSLYNFFEFINEDYAIRKLDFHERKFVFHFYDIKDKSILTKKMSLVASLLDFDLEVVDYNFPPLKVSLEQYQDYILMARIAKLNI